MVNDTGLPDELVVEAVQDMFVEHAGLRAAETNFQVYAQEGSLLARRGYVAPRNVFDEIKLARDLAERDDDVAAVIGSMVSVAFAEGMRHHHEDEKTVALFNEIGKHAKLDSVWKEMYREYLISGSLTTATLFTGEEFRFSPEGVDRMVNQRVSAPLIGVLPGEQIRVIGNDLFGTASLYYKPDNPALEAWLRELFNPRTTPAKKNELRQRDPVMAYLLVEQVEVSAEEVHDLTGIGDTLWRLNPRAVHRTTMPKGSWLYPRPPLTRNFALLEAKRLLNIMDYALLQGGSNFIVVAKKGTDQRPASDKEVRNLGGVVQRASRTGVIVGDHRLNIEIITPDLKELLSSPKRRLIGRKIAGALLRVPESAAEEPGSEGAKIEVEYVTRTITSDRHDLRRHVENYIYEEAVTRNQAFNKGGPEIWFPKVVLQGLNYFTDLILKLSDRGSIPRRYAVEAGGFDYDAAVRQRKREKAAGHDRLMVPPEIPFSGAGGPQDNNSGRPPGTSSGNGAPGGRNRARDGAPRRQPVIRRTPGETVTAWWDPDEGRVLRAGDLTYAILEQYEDSRSPGRIQQTEYAAIAAGEVSSDRGTTIIPVNQDYEVEGLEVAVLAPGLRMLLGRREEDGAIVAKALAFREPEFTVLDAEEHALKWGFDISKPEPEEEEDPS